MGLLCRLDSLLYLFPLTQGNLGLMDNYGSPYGPFCFSPSTQVQIQAGHSPTHLQSDSPLPQWENGYYLVLLFPLCFLTVLHTMPREALIAGLGITNQQWPTKTKTLTLGIPHWRLHQWGEGKGDSSCPDIVFDANASNIGSSGLRSVWVTLNPIYLGDVKGYFL